MITFISQLYERLYHKHTLKDTGIGFFPVVTVNVFEGAPKYFESEVIYGTKTRIKMERHVHGTLKM